MNLMKKGLILSSKYNADYDRYTIRIISQPKFFKEDSITYNNRDITIHSSVYPEWDYVDDIFYIQGNDISYDSLKINVTARNYFRIKRAVTDCNNALCKINKSSIY